MLAQYHEDSHKEISIYYASRKLAGYEVNYTALEKACVALVWVTQKLRHYMLAFPIKRVYRMDPIKYLLKKPALSRRMARWLMLLTEFDIVYVTQKVVNGRAISDYLADYPVEETDVWISEFPNENVLYTTQDCL